MTTSPSDMKQRNHGMPPVGRLKLREGRPLRSVDGVFTPESLLDPLDGPAASPQPQPLERRHLAAVVRRLERVAADYLATAPRVGVQVTLADLDFVLQRLLSESQGIMLLPPFGDDTKGFFLSGLYDELLREPSNVFHQIEVSDEAVRLEALTAEFWRACLELWHEKLSSAATRQTVSDGSPFPSPKTHS